MEHKRKKQWILIIMLLLTVCSVFVVYAGREWMFTNPFKPYTFSSVSYASGDGDGCTYVIDDSNRKILKISADAGRSDCQGRNRQTVIKGKIYINGCFCRSREG